MLHILFQLSILILIVVFRLSKNNSSKKQYIDRRQKWGL